MHWLTLAAAAALAAAPVRDAAPLPLAYVVKDGHGVVLAAGKAELEAGRVFVLEAQPDAGRRVELSLSSRPSADGRVEVRFDWKETSAPGGRVAWSAALSLARGATADARVEVEGGARVLELSAR